MLKCPSKRNNILFSILLCAWPSNLYLLKLTNNGGKRELRMVYFFQQPSGFKKLHKYSSQETGNHVSFI